MAKKDKNTTKEKEREEVRPNKLVRLYRNERVRISVGLFVVICCLFVSLSFISFFFTGAADQSILQGANPGDALDLRSQIQNWTGYRGAKLADFFINRTFGISCFCPLFFVFVLGIRGLGIKCLPLFRTFVITSFSLFWLSLFFGFFFVPVYESTFLYLGGEHGYYLSKWFEGQIGWFGTFLLLCVSLLIFCILEFSSTLPFLRDLRNKILKREVNKADEGDSPETGVVPVLSLEDGENDDEDDSEDNENQDDETETEQGETEIFKIEEDEEQEAESQEQPSEDDQEDASPDSSFEIKVASGGEEDEEVSAPETQTENAEEPEKPQEPNAEGVDLDIVTADPEDLEEVDLTKPYDPTLDLSFYKYPTIDLLKQYPNLDNISVDVNEQNEKKNKIVQTLADFGINIDKVTATVGPTVTLYEIVPARGVRITKVKSLESDIALSLSALGIRIIAPIPGKGTIGIEVPNSTPQIVPMRNVIASKKFQETKYDLPIVLGRTITNEVFMADLAKMPHLLVAGATGQGKSVGLNAIITSLLYKKHPSQLKLVMVDPKKVEFTIYSSIDKHFLAKLPDEEDAIVTDVTKVVQTLTSLCKEMDTRYELLKAAHCRNLKEYNEKFINRQLNPNNGHRYLPYIVVIIDEFGDLIMTAGKEVELPIARIAQLARAVGMHMVIATQRPTTNIITGTIKANFPARIAFRVQSMIDSRTILDAPGANQLIGRGDMLFSQGSETVRVQCAFIDTPEVEAVTEFISQQQGYPMPFALPDVDNPDGGESGAANVDLSKLDPMFEQAAELIVTEQSGSTSLIQRKFSLGYNRAGRIMDQMEAAGIVGPIRGSKPREVLVVDILELESKLSVLRRK